MLSRIYLLFLSLFFSTFLCHSQSLNQDIDSIIDKTLAYANVGVLVKEAQSGQVIYARNATKLFSPASNVKLFTAAAALYQLGENYHYVTSLAQDKNNFYLTFSGSPSLTTKDLKELILNLKKLGIKSIAGNLVLDTSRFSPPDYASGLSYDDMGWYYAAPSSAIILNGNAAGFDFISAKNLNLPIQIIPQTPDNGLTLINEVITVAKAQEKKHCSLHIEIKANNTLRLFGCFAQDPHPKRMQLAIPDPFLLARQIIKTTLAENGIALKGNIIEGKTPPKAQIIAYHQSKELSKLIAHMLEESDNLYADSLTKLLAFVLTNQGTYKQGAYAIKKILAQHINFDMNQLDLVDGNGTRYNLISPEQIVNLLTSLYHDEKMKPIFLNSLPRMGVSGTLKDRMKKTSLENNALAKTGTMHDVSALSGYLNNATGKTLIFSIIINDVNGNISKAKGLEESILLAVYKR